MSVKHFCDNCGVELTIVNMPSGGTTIGRLGGIDIFLAFDVITGYVDRDGNTNWNAGDFCRYCIFKAIKNVIEGTE